MFLLIKKINKELFEKSNRYFEKDYINLLKNKSTFKQSLISRYLLSKKVEKYFQIKNFLPKIDKIGKPIFYNNIYWSISHKDDYIFIGIGKQNFGIDIEILKNRDISLLNSFDKKEYKILGGEKWDNFYVLWTAKESIIKNILGNFDDIYLIKLEKINKINYKKQELIFSIELFFDFKGKKFKVLSGNRRNLYYSICHLGI